MVTFSWPAPNSSGCQVWGRLQPHLPAGDTSSQMDTAFVGLAVSSWKSDCGATSLMPCPLPWLWMGSRESWSASSSGHWAHTVSSLHAMVQVCQGISGSASLGHAQVFLPLTYSSSWYQVSWTLGLRPSHSSKLPVARGVEKVFPVTCSWPLGLSVPEELHTADLEHAGILGDCGL